MFHFNDAEFLGPYPNVMATKPLPTPTPSAWSTSSSDRRSLAHEDSLRGIDIHVHG
jgi:hypothetical protein